MASSGPNPQVGRKRQECLSRRNPIRYLAAWGRSEMRRDSLNPGNNCIPPGIKEETLISAIGASGYPLQGQVAYLLSSKHSFSITEEWGFVDSVLGKHRTLVVVASKKLPDGGQLNVRP